MRIFSALALTLILAFSVAGCTGSKIAVVDPARLFQESAPGKAGIEHLKQIESAMQAQLQVAQGLIEKAPNDEALRARFQKTFLGYQQLVTAEQQKVVESINALMQKTLDAYRTKNSYAVIMGTEGLLSFDPKVDVTAEIIKEMDLAKLTFEQVKLEPLNPEEPKAGAPKTEAPKADAPKTDAPKADAPKTETPKTDTKK